MKVKVTEEQLKRIREDKSVEPLSNFEVKMLEMLHRKDIETTGVREFMMKISFDNEEALDIALLYDLNDRPEDGYASIKNPIREPDLENYETEQVVLYKFLLEEGHDELINIIQLESNSYDHYGMKLYIILGSDDEWTLGTDSEADDAHRDYAENIVSEWDQWFEPSDLLQYDVVEFDDYFLDDEVHQYVEDMSIVDLLQEAGMDEEYDTLEEEWDEKIEKASAAEVDQVKVEMEQALNMVEAAAFDAVRDNYLEIWKDEFNDDPIQWFYDHWGLDNYQIIRDYGDLDEEALRDYITSNWPRGEALGSYDGYEHEFLYNDVWYYLYQIN